MPIQWVYYTTNGALLPVNSIWSTGTPTATMTTNTTSWPTYTTQTANPVRPIMIGGQWLGIDPGRSQTGRMQRVQHVQPARPETPEERTARLAREERTRAFDAQRRVEWDQREAARQATVAAAKERSRELLISFLAPDERQEFEAHQQITMRGKSGQRYRIRTGTMGNVDVLKNGHSNAVKHRLCFHPSDHSLPTYDVMLAQLLHLRHDDVAAVRIANKHSAPL